MPYDEGCTPVLKNLKSASHGTKLGLKFSVQSRLCGVWFQELKSFIYNVQSGTIQQFLKKKKQKQKRNKSFCSENEIQTCSDTI